MKTQINVNSKKTSSKTTDSLKAQYTKHLNTIFLLLFFCLGQSQPTAAYESLPDSCEFDPHVLTCFWPYDIELRDFHEDQIDVIAIEIKNSFEAKKPINEILLMGHASTWKPTDPVQQNAVGRAMSARNMLIKLLGSYDIPINEINIIATGIGDDEPRFSNESGEGRAYNRRVEITLTHVPPKEEPKDKPKPSPKKNNVLVFSKNKLKEAKTGFEIPIDMPPARFPKGYKGCSKKQRNRIELSWVRAHYNIWRADQVMDWLAAHSKKRVTAWKQGAPASKGDYTNPSPRNWFGPYNKKRFNNIDAAIEKVFSKRFLGRTFTIACKKQPKKHPTRYGHHAVFGHIVLYDHFFNSSVFEQSRMLLHEIFHHVKLHNGTWVMDTHIVCDKKCTKQKHYMEAASQDLSWGTKEKHYRLATRNNDNYAFFIKLLGTKIHRGKLQQFPPIK